MPRWAALTAVSALLVGGCGAGPSELLGGRDAVIGTDARQLGELVTLPATPRSTVWELRRVGDPGSEQYRLTAVIDLEPADADRVLDGSPVLVPARTTMIGVVPDWFPQPARDELVEIDRGPAGRFFTIGPAWTSRVFDSVRMSGGSVSRIGNSSMLYLDVGSD